MDKLLKIFAENKVFANIIFLMVFVTGAVVLKQMIREDLPIMADDSVSVSIVWPGADPSAVEEGILRKIETATQGLEGIKNCRTVARENQGAAMFSLKSGYDPDKMLDKVRSRIGSISSFPADAEKPIITRPAHIEAVMVLYLIADKHSEADETIIKESSYQIKDELLRMEEISQVEISGIRDYEIHVEVSEEKLRQFGLTLGQIANVIRNNNLDLAAGNIKGSTREFRVRTLGRRQTAGELESLIILSNADGLQIPLSRIAEVKDTFEDGVTDTRIDGHPGLLINVFKTEKEDAVSISDAVLKFMDEKKDLLPVGMSFGIIFDATNATRDRINILIENGIYGLLIVLFILWLFVDFRLAFWVSAGIPFSIIGGLVILWLLGGTLNMVSLFSLLMVLGIVADDAIVVGESILHHRDSGKSSFKAVSAGVREVGKPVLVAVITSMVAFFPLMCIEGTMGKFIAILPVTVVACLLISLIECLIILPAHLNNSGEAVIDSSEKINAGRSKIRAKKDRINFISQVTSRYLNLFINGIYQPVMKKLLKFRYVTICTTVTILLLSIGLVLGGFLKFVLFPDSDGFRITASVEFPEGTPLEKAREANIRLENSLMKITENLKTDSGDPLIERTISLTGQTLGDEAGEVEDIGSHLTSVQAILLKPEKRGIRSQDLLSIWEKEVGSVPGARSISFFTDSLGDSGPAIEISISGKDMDKLIAAGDLVQEQLKIFEGTYNVQSDYTEGKNEICLRLKPEAYALGLSVRDLADQIYSGYFGAEAVAIQRGREEVKIKVRYSDKEREHISSLDHIMIRTSEGDEVPLRSVANVSIGPGIIEINRKDGLRQVNVTARVNDTITNADQILDELESGFLEELKTGFPDVLVQFGGEEEENDMTMSSLMVGFPAAIFLIYLIIAASFKSYVQPLVILCVIPFGIAGAIFGHLLLGHDLCLISIFGMVAITGVIINDAIVLIERINANLCEGMSFYAAIINGCSRRFKAVFLTSISTIGGLIPLIMESNPHVQMLIPMAIAIVGGMMFSTVITLVIVPCLMYILNDIRTAWYRLVKGQNVLREETEPGWKPRISPAEVN